MKSRHHLALAPALAITIALPSGCSMFRSDNAPPPPVATVAVPVSGTELDQANVSKVRFGETLKAYPVNRYVDPADPNILHESHLVYRKETGANWNLSPHAPTVVPLGPVIAVSHSPDTPAPAAAADLEQRLTTQTRLMTALVEQNETLTSEITKLNGELTRLRDGEKKNSTQIPTTPNNTQ
jgi:hypothetical protein